jgi:hypothetical protein
MRPFIIKAVAAAIDLTTAAAALMSFQHGEIGLVGAILGYVLLDVLFRSIILNPILYTYGLPREVSVGLGVGIRVTR